MRVLINAASANMGGAVTYLQNIAQWLPRLAPSDQCTVYLPAATHSKLAALEQENLRLITYPGSNTGGLRRIVFDQVDVPRITRQSAGDVVFSSTGFGSFKMPAPQVLLVRNAAYFDPAFQARYRELGRSLRHNTLRRWHSLLSIRGADVVLFPTHAMKALVESYMDLSGKRTEVIPYGFDRDRFFADEAEEPDIVAAMRRWKAEGEQVLLSVSTYAVHKNFETLIEALPYLRDSGLRFRLVTTTSRDRTTDRAEYDALQRRAEQLGVRDLWVESGYVAYDQLQALYREADAYVFPSFTESFGHSLVEAMACGVPVVAAGMPVNREVCGDAGRYFATFDPEACAQAVQGVLSDAAVRHQLKEAALRRATNFSWRTYTEQLLAIFRSLVAES